MAEADKQSAKILITRSFYEFCSVPKLDKI